MRPFTVYSEIESWRVRTERWWFWWTAALDVNCGERTKHFRARSEDGAKQKAYAWIETNQ